MGGIILKLTAGQIFAAAPWSAQVAPTTLVGQQQSPLRSPKTFPQLISKSSFSIRLLNELWFGRPLGETRGAGLRLFSKANPPPSTGKCVVFGGLYSFYEQTPEDGGMESK